MTERTVRRMIPLFETYGIRKAALFGSCARRQETEGCDIDLVVSFGGHYDLLDIIGLKQDIEDAVNMPVDIITYESLQGNAFAKAVCADERVIYKNTSF